MVLRAMQTDWQFSPWPCPWLQLPPPFLPACHFGAIFPSLPAAMACRFEIGFLTSWFRGAARLAASVTVANQQRPDVGMPEVKPHPERGGRIVGTASRYVGGFAGPWRAEHAEVVCAGCRDHAAQYAVSSSSRDTRFQSSATAGDSTVRDLGKHQSTGFRMSSLRRSRLTPDIGRRAAQRGAMSRARPPTNSRTSSRSPNTWRRLGHGWEGEGRKEKGERREERGDRRRERSSELSSALLVCAKIPRNISLLLYCRDDSKRIWVDAMAQLPRGKLEHPRRVPVPSDR